jgi:hypothetical protein
MQVHKTVVPMEHLIQVTVVKVAGQRQPTIEQVAKAARALLLLSMDIKK